MPCTVILGTCALVIQRSKLRLKFLGSTAVPWRVVNTRPLSGIEVDQFPGESEHLALAQAQSQDEDERRSRSSGVHSRHEAVDRARALGLLAPSARLKAEGARTG